MKNILLLLAKGFEILEASAFIDVMGWNKLEGDGTTNITTCGLRKNITSSFDQKFTVDRTIDEIDVDFFDALAIPGGFEEYGYYKDAFDEKFQDIIKKFNEKKKPIASVCVGALPVAKTDILENKKATTYQNENRRNMLAKFGAIVSSEEIVTSDRIITSANPSTAVPVALLLLERLTSKNNADRVRKLMGF